MVKGDGRREGGGRVDVDALTGLKTVQMYTASTCGFDKLVCQL